MLTAAVAVAAAAAVVVEVGVVAPRVGRREAIAATLLVLANAIGPFRPFRACS